jgi:hypothetical protein
MRAGVCAAVAQARLTHLRNRQNENDNVQRHVDARKGICLSVDVDAFSSMQSVPALPNKADWGAIEPCRDEACSTKETNDDHENSALPLESFTREDPEIEQNNRDLREGDQKRVQELLDVEILLKLDPRWVFQFDT